MNRRIWRVYNWWFLGSVRRGEEPLYKKKKDTEQNEKTKITGVKKCIENKNGHEKLRRGGARVIVAMASDLARTDACIH